MIQLQFINYLLKTKDASILTLNNINNEFFSDYSAEFAYIKAHLDIYKTIPDQATFLSKFPEFDVLEVNETPQYLLSALFEDRNKRALARTFNEVREALNADDTEKAIQILNHSQENISKGTVLEAVDIFKDTSRYDAYVERTKNLSKYFAKTGFDELDEVICGWDREEELATIVARPGIGKSWVLLKTAIAAAKQGLNVGLYSGEMSTKKVGYRADTLISHISNTKIIHGNATIISDYKKFISNLNNEIPGSIKVLTPDKIDGPAGVSALRAFIEKEHLDMLCIDQHSLLEDDRKAKDAVSRASNISRDLKTLQTLVHIPIIAVSQQNRSSTEGGVGSEHVAQTDRISQDSTILIFLEQKDNVLTLFLGKCRDGASGKHLKYAIDLDKGIFNYIPAENDATNGESCKDLHQEFDEDYNEYAENPF